jgi:hypothetical protein
MTRNRKTRRGKDNTMPSAWLSRLHILARRWRLLGRDGGKRKPRRENRYAVWKPGDRGKSESRDWRSNTDGVGVDVGVTISGALTLVSSIARRSVSRFPG